MLFDLTQKAAPTYETIEARARAVVTEGLFTDDDQHDYFKGYRYSTEADALADTNATDLKDEMRGRKCRDDANLVAGSSYWYRFSSVDIYDNESAKSAPVSVTYRGLLDNERDQTAPDQPGTPTLTNSPGNYDDDDGTVENGLKVTTTAPEAGRVPRKYFVQLWRRPVADGVGTTDSLDGYSEWDDFQMRKPFRRFRANPNFYYKAQVTPISANDVWGTQSNVTSVGVRPTRADDTVAPPTAIHQRNRGDGTTIYVPKDDPAFDDARFKRVDWRISPTVDFDDPVAEDVFSDNNKYPLDDYDPGETVYVWARYRLRGGKHSDYTPSESGDGHEINIATVEDGSGEWGLGTASTLDFDTDGTLAANSDAKIATQKAVKTYAQPIDADLTAIAALVSAANKLPYATGSGTWALADFSAFGRTLVDDADASAARTTLGLAIGTNVQGYDATLASIAALGTASDKLAYTTGVDTWAEAAITSFGRSLIDDANASTARSTLGLVIGTDVQAQDAELAAIAGLTSAADRLPYFTGSGTASLATFTTFGRSLVDDADAAAGRTTLGVVIGADVQAYDADLAAIAALSSAANKLPYATGSGTWALTDLTSTARSLLDDISTSAMLTTLGAATDSAVVHLAGTETVTGQKTFSAAASFGSSITITGVNGLVINPAGTAAIEIGRTDGVASAPLMDWHSGAAAVDYDARITVSGGTGSNGGGTLEVKSAALTWNGVQVVDLSTSQALTTKTFRDNDCFFVDNSDATKKLQFELSGFTTATTRVLTPPNANGTIMTRENAETMTATKSISVNTASTAANYLRLIPTDLGSGNYGMIFQKSATAAEWDIILNDTVNNLGTLNILSGSLLWNSNQLADLATTQTFAGAKTFSLPPRVPTYTVATVPSAATYSRGLIYVSNETGGAVVAFSDGTNWRRVTDRAVVA